MKIKVAILERDQTYLARIMSVFGVKYADKLEIYAFTDLEATISALSSSRIDVLLACDIYEVDLHKIPNRCAFAYLVDSTGIDTLNERHAICKFQKADLIYKQILSVYAEKASSITGFTATGDEGQIIAFCSAAGGVGSSTMAAACATHFALRGKKVLYLNMEKLGSSDVFFSGQGQFDMSDLIFALKSKKTNLSLKLESCIKQDQNGVHFFSGAKYALDMMELTADDVARLISELKLMGAYDYIILDTDFGLDKVSIGIYRHAQTIILVGDGSAISNKKTETAFAALTVLEANADMPLTGRISYVYNKVSSKSAQSITIQGLKVLGGAPKYSEPDARRIVNQLAAMDIFDAIL